MQEPMFLPCGDYAPDQPDFGSQSTAVAYNVVPRTQNSYSPIPAFATSASSALNGRPFGAFSATDKSGNVGNYVGTASKLYCMTNASKPNFADVSGAAYTLPTGYAWNFTEAGGKVYATNSSEAIQAATTAAGTNFANHTDANAPKARFIAYILPGFLLVGDINDPTVGIKPQAIRWSALGNADSFPLIGSATAIANSSDWQDIAGAHGRMMGFASNLSSCAAAIFFQQAIFKMVYTGTATIFSITPVEELRGTPAPRSITQVGQSAFFLASNGFFAFDGTSAVPIGEGKVNRTFFTDVDPNYLDQVVGTADPTSGLIFWQYAGVGNTGGIPNRTLIYNPYINRWALIPAAVAQNLFLARTVGTNLDSIDALGFNLDTLPYSLDSDVLAGGNFVLAGFDSTYKFGAYTGANMAYTVDTNDVRPFAGRRARFSGVRPIVEGDAPSAALATRNLISAAPSYGTAVAQNTHGLCPMRVEAQFARVRLTGAAGNMATHIRGAEVEFTPGARA
jgi:hypothetical protein